MATASDHVRLAIADLAVIEALGVLGMIATELFHRFPEHALADIQSSWFKTIVTTEQSLSR